jgi:MFS family permease
MEARPKLLRTNASFRRLFLARAASFTGDGAALVALLLYVKSTQQSGTAVGGLLLAMSLPRVIGPMAGALADRMDRRTLMVACDLGQAAVFALIALVLPPYPVLLVLVVISATLTTAFEPASRSAMPALVESRDLPSANALLGTAFNLQIAVGPLLGGALVSGLGVRGAISANALSFMISAAFLLRLPPQIPTVEGERERLLADTKAGLAFVRGHAVAKAIVVTLFVGVSFAALDNVALVFLARDSLRASEFGFGALNASFGIGMILASLLMLRFAMRVPPRALFLAGWAISAAGTLATGLAPVLLIAIGFQVLAGSGNGLDNIARDTLIQRTVPGAMLGRVYGLTGTAAFLSSGLAYAAGGVLLDFMSARTVFVIAGAGTFAAVLIANAMLPSGAGEPEAAVGAAEA